MNKNKCICICSFFGKVYIYWISNKKKILYIVFILRFVYFDVNYKNVYVLIYDGIYYKEFKNFYFLLIYNIVYW